MISWLKFHRTEESDMDRFNHSGWINITSTPVGIRRAHMNVVDVRERKGLWMMHVCIMSEAGSDMPIFGFDVIAGRKKITGAFLDFSPGTNKDHIISKSLNNTISRLNWSSKRRKIPDWGKEIFSDNILALGNIKKEIEVEKLCALTEHAFCLYLDYAPLRRDLVDKKLSLIAQNRYAEYQKMNPHTARVMKSLGLPPDEVDYFIENCLFPFVKLVDK